MFYGLLFFHIVFCPTHAESQIAEVENLIQPALNYIDYNITYFNVTGCMAFFAKSIEIGEIKLPPIQDFDTSQSKCDPETSILVFSYKDVEEIKALNIRMEFTKDKSGYWRVSNSTLSMSCVASPKKCEEILDGSLVFDLGYTPVNMSYKCTKPSKIRIKPSADSFSMLKLSFKSLQVQPFGVVAGRFGGQVSDCVGLFSIPIWSALFVSFILIAILTYGLTMLASIQPNEFYDDPKEKLIQLGANN